jgi:hypothetical protein
VTQNKPKADTPSPGSKRKRDDDDPKNKIEVLRTALRTGGRHGNYDVDWQIFLPGDALDKQVMVLDLLSEYTSLDEKQRTSWVRSRSYDEQSATSLINNGVGLGDHTMQRNDGAQGALQYITHEGGLRWFFTVIKRLGNAKWNYCGETAKNSVVEALVAAVVSGSAGGSVGGNYDAEQVETGVGHQGLYRKSPDAEQPERTFLRLADLQDGKFENHLVGTLLTWSHAAKQPLDITAYKKARGDLRAFMKDGWMDGHDASAAVSAHSDYMTPKRLSAFLNGSCASKGVAQRSIDSLVQFFESLKNAK